MNAVRDLLRITERQWFGPVEVDRGAQALPRLESRATNERIRARLDALLAETGARVAELPQRPRFQPSRAAATQSRAAFDK